MPSKTGLNAHALPRWVRIGLGVLLLIIGFLGVVLPLIQGFVFLAAGALLLADAIPSFRKALHSAEVRVPKIRMILNAVRNKEGGIDLGKMSLWLAGSVAVSLGVFAIYKAVT